jgi:hypothetical protein
MICEVSADLKSVSAAADSQAKELDGLHHRYCRDQFWYNICSTATSTLL